MRRRDFVTSLGGAVAWPLAARAQQATLPVVGFLTTEWPDQFVGRLNAFREGLSEGGYAEGRNLTLEYRWANRNDQLPALADELVRRRVSAIVADSTPAVLAASGATSTIPIVFQLGTDPVELRLVASLARPGGNLTGAVSLNVELGAKRLELLHEMVPTATIAALLIDPSSPALAQTVTRDLQAAADTLRLQSHILRASSDRGLDMAFATLTQLQANALVIGPGPLFMSGSKQLAALTTGHAIPAISPYREFAAAGGLISYGANSSESYRQVGTYTARILKGEKPADLPVQRVTRVELVINLKTAKALGLTVPLPLLGRADEVIE
jgi:putative ABC transport system substrate-binding protein